jgi:phosphoesterase RecJ-like protein
MDQQEQLYTSAYKAIRSGKNILLVTHFNPDGDGLSSACALAEYLSSTNQQYTLYCQTEPAKTFGFLPHVDEFIFKEDLQKIQKPELPINFADYDLIIVLDCGALSRTKLEVELTQRRPDQIVIEFDHHPHVDSYANIEIRETTSAATAEVVYNFFQINKIHLNKTIANILMTGLVTDTANFLYPSTSEDTIRAASELISHGAHLPRITDYTLRNKSLEAMKLWGRIMASLQINAKYNLAITVLPKEEFFNNQIDKEELEGVSGFLSNLYGVSGLLFLREEGDGLLRGSLRTSHPKIDISRLAKLFGGGGHAKASGFLFKGELEKTKNGWRVK